MATEVMQLSRRTFFRTVGALGAACVAGGLMTSRLATAAEAAAPAAAAPAAAPAAPPVDINALMKEKIGSDTFTEGKVNVGVKLKPDSGSVVPVPITVDHPMEAGNFVESVAIFVDNNPNPYIGKFSFTPEAGAVNFEVQIKMAKTSKLRVVAKTSKGEFLGWAKDIEVPAGGCAG